MVNRQRAKAIGSLLGSFVLGAIAAGAGYHAYAERRNAELFSGDRDAIEARHLEAMSRDLDLSSEQRARVRAVMVKFAPERKQLMRDMMTGCGAKLAAHREQVDAEIAALLTPVQRTRFEGLRAERKRQLFGPAPSPSGR